MTPLPRLFRRLQNQRGIWNPRTMPTDSLAHWAGESPGKLKKQKIPRHLPQPPGYSDLYASPASLGQVQGLEFGDQGSHPAFLILWTNPVSRSHKDGRWSLAEQTMPHCLPPPPNEATDQRECKGLNTGSRPERLEFEATIWNLPDGGQVISCCSGPQLSHL